MLRWWRARDEAWALARAFDLLDRGDGAGPVREDRAHPRVWRRRFSFYIEMSWIVPAGELRSRPCETGIFVSRITGRARYALLL